MCEILEILLVSDESSLFGCVFFLLVSNACMKCFFCHHHFLSIYVVTFYPPLFYCLFSCNFCFVATPNSFSVCLYPLSGFFGRTPDNPPYMLEWQIFDRRVYGGIIVKDWHCSIFSAFLILEYYYCIERLF